jgi:hypothetical protein
MADSLFRPQGWSLLLKMTRLPSSWFGTFVMLVHPKRFGLTPLPNSSSDDDRS